MRTMKALFALATAAALGFGAAQAAASEPSERVCSSTYEGVPAYCSPDFDCDAVCDQATGNSDSYGFCSARGCCVCIAAG